MKKQSIDWNGASIVIKYGNGSVFTGDTSELPEAIFIDTASARHGLQQKLGDAKSGGTAGEKYAEVLLIWDALKNGDWHRRGSGEGVEALMERAFVILAESAKMAEKAEAWFAAYSELSEEEKETTRSKPAIKAAIEKAKAEKRLAGKVGDGEEGDFDPFA